MTEIFVILLIGVVLLMIVAARHQETVRRLRESEHRMRGILESTQEGFVQADLSGLIDDVNPAFCAMLGRRREDLLGHRLGDFLTEESADVYAGEMVKRTAGRRSNYQLTLRRPDGTFRHGEFHGAPIFGREGQRAGAFALVTDISERIAHEAYQRQAIAVFENTGEGVTITDPKGRILHINQSFTKITGYTLSDVEGKSPALLQSGRHREDFYLDMWKRLETTGHWQGEIWNRRKSGEIYPEWLTISAVRDEDGAVENYIGVFSDISRIKRSEEDLQRMANYDPLTGLANRLLLGVQLRHALDRAGRHGYKLAVMEIDLDGFKNVNDTLGHPAGDKLLQIIATRLTGCLRGEDIVSRLGGDEFAIVLENVGKEHDAGAVAGKLIAAVAPPMQLEGQMARVTASIGIAIYPDDGPDATALMKAADTALYVSKREGRNTHRYYSGKMAASVQQRHETEQGLRQALENGSLEVWYQPQISLKEQCVAGVEALLRWRCPRRGVVAPGEFLPIARETGLILPIGEWVLRQACHQMSAWRNAGLNLRLMTVNVDGQQMVRSDFVATVETVLAETGMPASMLELEMTENFLLENAENGMGAAMRFSEMGVEVAIDDFGTGYSSLSYLKYFRADALKIDKSFVYDLPADIVSASIIGAIVHLGRGLDFRLVAEGVETREQLAYLMNAGCDWVQGHYFASPMPAAEFEAWMRNHTSLAADFAEG